ncbi:MAG: phage tail protein [Kofleriaceae bacterium]
MAIPRPNPYSNFNFILIAGDQEIAAFSEISGLDSENTPIEYREGADAINGPRKLPGVLKHSNVVCKRGITGHTALWDWRKEVRDGIGAYPPSRTVTIKLLDERGDRNAPAMTWTLRNAWPMKITGPTLNAKGNDFAVEQLDLVHELLEIS